MDHSIIISIKIHPFFKGFWRWKIDDFDYDTHYAGKEKCVIDGVEMETDVDFATGLQDMKTSRCPCDPSRTIRIPRNVCSFFIYPKDNQSRLRELVELIEPLREARENSAPRMARARAREQLLTALWRLDTIIVKETALEVIKSRGVISKESRHYLDRKWAQRSGEDL